MGTGVEGPGAGGGIHHPKGSVTQKAVGVLQHGASCVMDYSAHPVEITATTLTAAQEEEVVSGDTKEEAERRGNNVNNK